MKTIKLLLPLIGILIGAVSAFATHSTARVIPGDVNAYYFNAGSTSCGNVVKICSTSGIIICEELGTGIRLYGKSATSCDITIYEKE